MLRLRYHVSGDIGALALPAVTTPARANELWRHTCFEAFVRGEGEGYREFNFSPSTCWAAYRFDGYRTGMADAPDAGDPHIEGRKDSRRYDLTASLPLGAGPFRLGLSAILEDRSGERSYWALAHAPGKPDFHHINSFTLDLPAVDQP